MAGKFNLKKYLKQRMRMAWLRSPYRNEAMKNARLSRGVYKCQACASQLKRKEVQIDHKVPVEFGAKNWDRFIENLFCPSSRLQALCKPCHMAKTAHDRMKYGV